MARKGAALQLAPHPGGRPRLYESPALFEAKVEAYFASDEGQKFPTLSGLCVFMGFCDKQSFSTYEGYGPEFSLTVNKTRLRIENHRHQALIQKDTFTPGIIFDLKNNHGWKDKQELEVTGNFAALLAERRKRASK
jgi:hypothetical protein